MSALIICSGATVHAVNHAMNGPTFWEISSYFALVEIKCHVFVGVGNGDVDIGWMRESGLIGSKVPRSFSCVGVVRA